VTERDSDRSGSEHCAQVAENLGDQRQSPRRLRLRIGTSHLGRFDPASLIGIDQTSRNPSLQLLAQQRRSG
jgi:hypothetical protein